jgi:hypothetical protein
MVDGEDKPTGLKKLERNSRGELLAHVEGRAEPVENVTVARCFPWSLKDEYVSIRDKDGKEIVLLRDLEGLDPATRELIEEELRDKFFVPRIQRITRYKAEFDVVSISAETDRGKVTFQIRNRDDVRLLSPVRALFRDVDGNVYEVEDYRALDRSSQKHLEPYF